MLRSMCVFLKHIGYSGLVLYLDELELLFDQPRKQSRDMAYDTLRQLVEGTDGTPSFVLMGSATRLMLSHDKKGFPSFPPLAQRLGLPWLAAADDEFPDYRSTVIDLGSKSARLTEKELLMLVKRVRTAHGLALKWDADKHVPDAFLSDLAQTVDQQRGEFPAPRLLVEVVVSVLERKEQNTQMQLEQALPALLKQAKERIRDMEAKRHRPWSAEGSA